jgi:hypothetical protein
MESVKIMPLPYHLQVRAYMFPIKQSNIDVELAVGVQNAWKGANSHIFEGHIPSLAQGLHNHCPNKTIWHSPTSFGFDFCSSMDL